MSASKAKPEMDRSVAHSARRYDYWLGGKDNFAADRESGDAIAQRWPHVVTAARENRKFLQRAARYCAEQLGIRQFLDIGTGLPTVDNTHEVAQRVDPACRIVYVDNDPNVLVHARALLTSTREGVTSYIDADLRNPQKILADPALATTLDLREPVALMLVAVMHFIPEDADPYGIVDTLKDALAPGSVMVLSHGSYDLIPKASVAALTGDDYPGKGDFHPRTRKQVSRFFHDLHLVEPGPDSAPLRRPKLGVISEWGRTDGEQPPAAKDVSMWGAVGRVGTRGETASRQITGAVTA